jgi:hypothetical protein
MIRPELPWCKFSRRQRANGDGNGLGTRIAAHGRDHWHHHR